MPLITKVTLLGDGAVGKTALRDRYMGKKFNATYLATLGADFAVKTLPLGKTTIKFQIWDLAGQPRFSTVRELYYRGAVGALLIFDVMRRDSFENVLTWREELWGNCGKEKIPFILVGNKIDLRANFPEEITTEEGENLSKRLSEDMDGFEIPYLETSAKSGANVDRAFALLGENITKFLEGRRNS